MNGRLISFIISLTILSFTGGCLRGRSEPATLPEVQPAKDGLPEAEPQKTELIEGESVNVSPPQDESPAVEPNESELVVPESVETKPIEFQSNGVVPNQITATESEPERSAQIESRSNKVQVSHVEPNEVVAVTTEPIQVEPSEGLIALMESNSMEPNDVHPNGVKLTKVEPDDTAAKRAAAFHDKCSAVLRSYVDAEGMVDYKTLRRKRLELKALLREFDNLDPNEYESWPGEDKIAFWINAYNIQMLKIITYNYPVKGSRWLNSFWGPSSIRHIKGIWTDYKFLVMDEEFTLAEIEERFFRKEFDDPRTFLALSYASVSGPPLRNKPYYGHKLNKQLKEQAKRFLSDPHAFRIDKEKGKVYLSSIFQATWHGKEFISKYHIDRKFKDHPPVTRAVLNFITNYISEHDVHFLETGNYSFQYIKYDWTINEYYTWHERYIATER